MSDKQSSIRTPLGHARGLGSAKEGTHHWWMQRVSAVALIPLSIYVLSALPFVTENSYSDFINWLSAPSVAIVAILFVLTSFYHAALGIQVIIEDYAESHGWKLSLLMLNNFAFIVMSAASVFSIVYISFTHGR
jgi:succinate dehydrogenase / fumarate reductase membrane anchor subunit